VGAVVLDVVQLRLQRVDAERFDDFAAEVADLGAVGEAPLDRAERRALRGDEADALEEARVRIAVDGEVVDVIDVHTSLIEAVANRRGRESRPVLDAAEALLLRGGDELAVDDDAGGSVRVVGVDSNDNHGS
jgi:hypothetical protein